MLKSAGRDSSVCIASRYGLDGPGFESWGGGSESVKIGPGALLYNAYRVSFLWVKRPRRGVDNPNPSSTEVKEAVELCLYSPHWSLTVRCRVNFILTFNNSKV